MLGAVDYLARAGEMRRFAEQERDPATRERFLQLAAEYEKLAQRAASRAGNATAEPTETKAS